MTTKQILKKYSEYLEKYGYIDTDWREEKPTAIERFMEENKSFPLDAEVSREAGGSKTIILTEEDVKFIMSLIVDWAKEIPEEAHAYDPMYFGTLSRDRDINVHKKLCDILKQPYNIKTDSQLSG